MYVMEAKTEFSRRVYDIVARIPPGRVATYKQVAALAGNPNAARAVGMLMSRNKNPRQIPCHRVVGAGGALVGYAFSGTDAKKEKLANEGVHFSGMRVTMPLHTWRPTPKALTRRLKYPIRYTQY